jgi:hypothetical protein
MKDLEIFFQTCVPFDDDKEEEALLFYKSHNTQLTKPV